MCQSNYNGINKMTVKELIEILQMCNPEGTVTVRYESYATANVRAVNGCDNPEIEAENN